MRILLICTDYPPLRTSGAIQMRDLAKTLCKQGYKVYLISPTESLATCISYEEDYGVQIMRLPAMRIKDQRLFFRSVAEIFLPYFMLYGFIKSEWADLKFDGIIWYSPSIFLGKFVSFIKNKSNCNSYLILRDIFPEWALNLGLIKRGIIYYYFKKIEMYQYSVADIIGVQSESNIKFVTKYNFLKSRVEVLHNWMAPSENIGCKISISNTHLSGRKILIYSGNIGAAQKVEDLLDLAGILMPMKNIGVVFIGRGSQFSRLKEEAEVKMLDNVLFLNEINPSEMPGLLEQCHIGLISLDLRHQTHNIPGKLLGYLQAGLPVFAKTSTNSDLAKFIKDQKIGVVCDGSVHEMMYLIQNLINDLDNDTEFASRCKLVSRTFFSEETAAKQIINSVKNLKC